jgi:hypothetical protein
MIGVEVGSIPIGIKIVEWRDTGYECGRGRTGTCNSVGIVVVKQVGGSNIKV